MVTILFFITLTTELLALACSAYSLISPENRIWPSPGLLCWQSYLMWTLFLGSAAGILFLGVLDWGSSHQWTPWVRYGVGVPLWLVGQGFSLWSMSTLGWRPSFGAESQLVLRGPYKVSRNPQYLGYSVGLIGWGLISGSTWTLIAALMGVLTLDTASRAEERYLKARYGAEYEAYLKAVPRYFSISRRKDGD